MLFPFQIRSQKLPFSKHIVEKHYIRTYPTDSSCTFPSPAPRNHPSKWCDCRTNREAWEFHLCLTCIALFSWFLCRSLAEHVESCYGWIHYPIHHSVSVGLPSGVIVNKETIQTSQLVPYSGVTDDEAHRINQCEKYRHFNRRTCADKLNYEDIRHGTVKILIRLWLQFDA